MDWKNRGGLYHMLYDMEQVALSTCRSCDPKERKMEKDWLHLDRYLSPESTQR